MPLAALWCRKSSSLNWPFNEQPLFMSTGDEIPSPAQAAPISEAERLFATVTNPDEGNVARQTADAEAEPKKNSMQPYDFRNPMLLTPGELRKLRMHEEEF